MNFQEMKIYIENHIKDPLNYSVTAIFNEINTGLNWSCITLHDGLIGQEFENHIKNSNLSEEKKRALANPEHYLKSPIGSWKQFQTVKNPTLPLSKTRILACLIFCEAGNQPYIGQVAVGSVVINRMRSAAFPNTMVGVIYQKKQFSPVASGRLATRLSLGATESCYRAADEAMAGSQPVGNCLFFRTVIPQIKGTIIGGHVFY